MKLGIMCSGNGTNFENIVTNPICKEHEVVLMIHNKKKCGAAKRAEKWGIPHFAALAIAPHFFVLCIINTTSCLLHIGFVIMFSKLVPLPEHIIPNLI